MSRIYDQYQSYSWHQSHDQATVLLLLPYDTLEDDVHVTIERNHIVAGVRGQAPILKGRVYGSVDVANSMWQLEPRTSRLSARERTTSSISTTSTQSSYAVVTEPEISSSFAASLEGGFVSDTDDVDVSSPALSSPISSMDEHSGSSPRRQQRFTISHPVSPHVAGPMSISSSFSSLESLHTGTGRLLTLHFEKAESIIWPSLVVGPVPNTLSPCNTAAYPWTTGIHPTVESKYNMDPTSMVLIALDLSDIRQSREEAFEYFIRAWHQAHVPSATIRLSTHYLPVNTVIPETNSASSSTTFLGASVDMCSTPTLTAYPDRPVAPEPGTVAYYLHYLGGSGNLAQLYLEAGLLYLEGTASNLLSSSYSGLSALRMSGVGFPQQHADPSSSLGGTEAWRRDRDTARRYFERARKLDSLLDIPLLPPSPESEPISDPESVSRRRRRAKSGEVSGEDRQLRVPIIDVSPPNEGVNEARRRRRKDEILSLNASSTSLADRVKPDDDDNTWYLYLPGIVGAGTALLVVGFLSFSSWRKGQGS